MMSTSDLWIWIWCLFSCRSRSNTAMMSMAASVCHACNMRLCGMCVVPWSWISAWPLPNRINHPPHNCDRGIFQPAFVRMKSIFECKRRKYTTLFLSFPPKPIIRGCKTWWILLVVSFTLAMHIIGTRRRVSPLTSPPELLLPNLTRSIKCSATRAALHSNCTHLYNSGNSLLTTAFSSVTAAHVLRWGRPPLNLGQ